jgi:hypothetical protein
LRQLRQPLPDNGITNNIENCRGNYAALSQPILGRERGAVVTSLARNDLLVAPEVLEQGTQLGASTVTSKDFQRATAVDFIVGLLEI